MYIRIQILNFGNRCGKICLKVLQMFSIYYMHRFESVKERQIVKKVSITLSFIWGILLLPLSFFCYIAAGMAFENLRDPNIADYIFKYL